MQSLISSCKKSIYFKTACIGPMLPLCLRVPKGHFLFCVTVFSVFTNVGKARDFAISMYNKNMSRTSVSGKGASQQDSLLTAQRCLMEKHKRHVSN
jgi:hypothetical protein